MNSSIEIQEQVAGEQRVWLAVIARSVEEWVSGSLRNQIEAEDYLLKDNSDFSTVCAAAGLDADALRAKLIRLKKNGAGPKPLHTVRSVKYEFERPAMPLGALEDATIAA
ncbi:MAG TPA: hypothetical protein VFO34_05310 [Candidatus Acidoferrales bacterium]|nr:hypothetical protein [Candidatus Acidoferrales bacterium]